MKSTGGHPAQGLVAGGVAGGGREHPEASATIGSRGLTRRSESGEREKFQVVRSCSRPGAGEWYWSLSTECLAFSTSYHLFSPLPLMVASAFYFGGN